MLFDAIEVSTEKIADGMSTAMPCSMVQRRYFSERVKGEG